MKRFVLWLVLALGLYAGLAIPYHFYLAKNPRRIAVAVDTSFEMESAMSSVRQILLSIATTRYAVFSLHTDKAPQHGWQDNLDAGVRLVAYGPRDLAALVDPDRYPEIRQADRLIVLTNAEDARLLGRTSGLEVIHPR
jgi:hypothetical protein